MNGFLYFYASHTSILVHPIEANLQGLNNTNNSIHSLIHRPLLAYPRVNFKQYICTYFPVSREGIFHLFVPQTVDHRIQHGYY